MPWCAKCRHLEPEIFYCLLRVEEGNVGSLKIAQRLESGAGFADDGYAITQWPVEKGG